jgi:ligand-binding sensor domain-containing protein/AraC-like DNA-binding protein
MRLLLNFFLFCLGLGGANLAIAALFRLTLRNDCNGKLNLLLMPGQWLSLRAVSQKYRFVNVRIRQIAPITEKDSKISYCNFSPSSEDILTFTNIHLSLKRLNILHLICLFLLLPTVSTPVFSQAPKISFKHLNKEQGLSDNVVGTIFQDTFGYMWFGTLNGLNRYDGYKITAFRNKADDSSSISNSKITTFNQDRKGNLWVGTHEGLNRFCYADNTFVRYTPGKNGIPDNRYITSIHTDKSGNLWCATDQGLYLYSYENDKFREVDNNTETRSSIIRLFEDSNGHFLILRTTGLYTFNTKTFKSQPFLLKNKEVLKDSTYHSIAEDRQGNLWIGSFHCGVTKINISKNLFKVYLSQNNPSQGISYPNACLLVDHNDNLWLGEIAGGLHLYNRATDTFYNYRNDPEDPNSLAGTTVSALYSDVQGNLWVGTNAGVEMYSHNLNTFNYYKAGKTNKNLSFKDIRAVAEDNNGNIIVGTDGGGLNIMNPADRTFKVLKNNPNNARSLSSNAVISLFKDRDGAIWVGTWGGGLNLYDPKTSTFSRFLQKNADYNNITTIYEDRQRNLWTAAYNNGLWWFDRKSKIFNKIDSRKTNFKGTTKPAFAEDRAGNLLIGTDQALNIYNRNTGKFSSYSIKKDHTHQSISAVFCDTKGRIWVGSTGLYLFDPVKKDFTNYGNDSALKNAVVAAMLEDEKGNLWVSTNNGLYRFNPETRATKGFHNSEGIQGLEFRKEAALKAKNGEFYFGGSNGLNSFFSSHIKTNKYIPPVYITGFQIFDKTILPGQNSILKQNIQETKEITLSYKESLFSFEFSAINYILSENNQYAYKMEGFDKNWNYVGNKRTATYNQLDPGEYTFRVKASNNDGVWNEKGASIKIIITPPYWATWWFRTLATLSVLASAFAFYRYRISERQQQQKAMSNVNPNPNGSMIEGEPKIRYRTSNLKSEDILAYKKRIEQYMSEKKPYLIDNLSPANLADQIGINTYHLSQVLNEGFGESFYKFISRYRVEESKKLLLNPAYSHYTILAIATESGFHTKSTFNKTFKEHTGISPSEFQKIHLQ